MHCEVSTLPATTAAGGAGSSIELAGMRISSGRRHPAFSGIGSASSVRNTYSTAAVVTARGALKLSGCCAEVPVKSTQALPALASIVTRTAITAPESIS